MSKAGLLTLRFIEKALWLLLHSQYLEEYDKVYITAVMIALTILDSLALRPTSLPALSFKSNSRCKDGEAAESIKRCAVKPTDPVTKTTSV